MLHKLKNARAIVENKTLEFLMVHDELIKKLAVKNGASVFYLDLPSGSSAEINMKSKNHTLEELVSLENISPKIIVIPLLSKINLSLPKEKALMRKLIKNMRSEDIFITESIFPSFSKSKGEEQISVGPVPELSLSCSASNSMSLIFNLGGEFPISEEITISCLTLVEEFFEGKILSEYDHITSKYGEIVHKLRFFKRKTTSALCHPFSAIPSNLDESGVTTFIEGKGTRLKDNLGKQYLDVCSGLWNTNVGLGHPKIIEAIYAQSTLLSYSPLFAERSNLPAQQLAAELLDIAPENLNWVIFTGSGSESTDVAIRLALIYQKLRKYDQRKCIAHLDKSYHGTFGSSASVSGLMPLRDWYQAGAMAIALPTPQTDGSREIEQNQEVDACINAFYDVAVSGRLAAFIFEPILGSAGVIIPPKYYFDRIQLICKEFDILLIVDEVATGFGRTGKWFASEHFDIRPDIMLLAKGINSGYLPLGAVMLDTRIGETFSKNGIPLMHGSTYNGHPVCCASASANIDILRREDLVERSRLMGIRFRLSLERLKNLPSVREIRGLGMMNAIEFEQIDGSSATSVQMFQLMKKFQLEGLLIYPALSTLTLCPALNIDEADLDVIVNVLEFVLREVILIEGTVLFNSRESIVSPSNPIF